MSNPDSNVDELRVIVQWFILPLFSIWVFYLGHIFTKDQLTGLVSPLQVTVLSWLLPATVQFFKLYGAKKALRAFHFKWYDRSAQEFYLWILVGLSVALMFVWSLKISVFDIKATTYAAISQKGPTLSEHLATATASIDGQIEAINKSSDNAATMKTKKGKISWSGQSIAIDNAKTLEKLGKQRETVVTESINQFKSDKTALAQTATEKSNFFQRFGGFGEIGEIIFVIILGLIEAINKNNNEQRLNSSQSPTQSGHNRHNGSPSNVIHNQATPTVTMFNRQPDGNVRPASPPPITFTVSQTPVTVTQNDYEGSDAILKNTVKAVRSDIPNFQRNDSNPATVSARINKALDACLENIKKDGFTPSYEESVRFYNYLSGTALPALIQKGWPYDNSSTILEEIYRKIPAMATT